CSLSFVLYLDRICMSQAVAPIESDLGLTHVHMSYLFAAFLVAYQLFQAYAGGLGDRYGSRGVLARIALWVSLFTALTGAATGFVMLLVVRFLFGAGEAGAFPNATRVLARWFPPGARASAQGAFVMSATLGGAAAPVATAYLIELVGWRWSFVLFGALGAIWAAAFYGWVRDDPAEHPPVNPAAPAHIRGRKPRHPAPP